MVYTLVLMRHGESEWNRTNRFTGWVDIPLSEEGVREAVNAAKLLSGENYAFDVCFTSLLQRAIKTAHIVLEECKQLWIPTAHYWQLNERMYGQLEGYSKSECVKEHGAEQVQLWRRSYAIPPPSASSEAIHNHAEDRRYANIVVPKTECLKDCVVRVVEHWEKVIAPALKEGKRVLIVAHGNSLRALVKHLDNIPDNTIVELNIPTGVPLVYTFDKHMTPLCAPSRPYNPLSGVYLGDEATVKAKITGVANQLTKG